MQVKKESAYLCEIIIAKQVLKVFKFLGMKAEVASASWREMPAVAPRPPYSVLENGCLMKLGLDQMQSIDAAPQSYLRTREAVAA